MKLFSIVASVALAAAASAQTPIGPFAGEELEDFSGPQQATFAPCLSYRVFGDTADLCTPTGTGCHTVDTLTISCTLVALSAPYFFISVDGAAVISFDYEVERFGGWFSTNRFFADAGVDFLDQLDNVLATTTAAFSPDCSWTWQGWNLGPSSGVRKVRIRGSVIFTEGLIGLDDLQVDYFGVQPPVVYCTAGTTTNGCVPAISATGTPSASASSGFVISVASVEGQKQGILFYGIDNAGFAPPAWGASSSFLCVKPPTQRTGTQSSGGTSGACDGTLTLDWNAYVAANPTALGAPFASGQHVFAQGWFRDPSSPKTTMLSDGLEFVVQP